MFIRQIGEGLYTMTTIRAAHKNVSDENVVFELGEEFGRNEASVGFDTGLVSG